MRKTVLVIAGILILFSGLLSAPNAVAGKKVLAPYVDLVGISDTSLTVSWKAVPKAAKYQIQFANNAKFKHARTKQSATLKLHIGKLTPQKTYYVRVRALTKNGNGLSYFSKALQIRTSKYPPKPAPGVELRVGSYNIFCSNCTSPLPEQRPWSERKASVVQAVQSRNLDVIGFQEASQGWLKDANGVAISLTQFEDLANALGSPWEVTNKNRNSCVNSLTPTNCVPVNNGASNGTKIFYRTDRLTLLAQGSTKLSKINEADTDRYVAWAIFRQNSTGKRFFFADTHLEHRNHDKGQAAYYKLREQQAKEVWAAIHKANTQLLPVILVGDFNSCRSDYPNNAPYQIFTKAGLVDPLGNTSRIPKNATVEKRIRAHFNSFQGFLRNAPNAGNSKLNGNNIDYILTTPMRVTEWETVVNIDSKGRLVGVLGSDHNMIRANVVIP